jgi:LacI family transcriptional regulator
MKKVTIKDIAVMLGISPHSVSKALNNKPGVSEELRQKVKDVAREMNYVPNVFGRGLSGKTIKTIGIIVPNDTNPAYSIIIAGMERKAANAGYNIILSNSHEDATMERKLIHMLLEKRVDGIILTPSARAEAAENIELLRQFEVPYVLLGRTFENQNHPSVVSQNVAGAYLVGQYLLQKGHRQVIYLTNKRSFTAVEQRIEGLQKAFSEQALSLPRENIYRCCEVNIESSYQQMLAILQQRRDFTAVFTYNDIVAYGAMKALYECRLRIPSDIAIVGFDNLMFSEICLVPLTTVDQHLPMLGKLAIQRLLNILQGKEGYAPLVMPEPGLVERQSA